MSRFIAGGNTSYLGVRDPCEELCKAIVECCELWRDDPAYKDVCYKLELVRQELDTLTHSAGRRATLRAAMPNHAGQEPSHRHSEAPMEVQRATPR